MGNTSKRYHWTNDQKAEFQRLYLEDEESIEDIAKLYGATRGAIRYHLRRAGVILRPTGCNTEKAKDKQRGENHHSWNGGRYKHTSGYWYALARGHPFAKNDYVYEHRLVMERHLLAEQPAHPALTDGRLSRRWVVHHKNGQKDDNRLENLEVLRRGEHNSWMHYHEEIARLKKLVGEAA